MRKEHPRADGHVRKSFFDLSFLAPLVVLFASSLRGSNLHDALNQSALLFSSPHWGPVAWLQVVLLDLCVFLYAAPIFNIYRTCTAGFCAPSEKDVDRSVRRLDGLSRFIIPVSVAFFVAGGIVRSAIEMESTPDPLAYGRFFMKTIESSVNGLFSGVVLSLGLENRLFSARATVLGLGSRRGLRYSSFYSRLILVMISIVLFLTVQIFSSTGEFFSLGLVGGDAFGHAPGDATASPLSGPDFLLRYGRFEAVKEALDVFALRLGIFAVLIFNLLFQLKLLIKRPLATVLDRLKALNSPSPGLAKAIDILKNDEFARVYELINSLIRRQEGEIEASRRKLENVIESAPDPIISIDGKGSIRVFNPAAEVAFGYPRGEAVGKSLDLVLPGAAAGYTPGTAAWKSKVGISRSDWKRADGSLVPMEAHASGGDEGEGAWTTIVLRDVRAQAEIEERLTRARIDAEDASRLKSEFLANMSHELRTPLNAILGFTQLMDGDKNLTEAQRDRIGVISRSGEHLLALINDILDISKIEAGKMDLHPVTFDLPRFVEDLGRMFELKCRKKGLALYVEALDTLPRYVEADLGKLRQVMINLLGNAVKFTEEGGISLLVGRDDVQAGAQRIRFVVRDTGRGIPESELKLIMLPFVQASTTDHEGGTGLGLAISSRYVAMMGGALEAESVVGEGSTFSFSLALPERSSPSGTESEEEAPIAVARGAEVVALVVDDQYTNRLVLKEMLERVGFTVIEASDGREAVATARETGPAIVFMDIKMPVMDGYEAVAALKGDPATAGIRVFALTASAFSHDEARILAAGFDGFLAKPFKLSALYRLIRDKGAVALEPALPAAPTAARTAGAGANGDVDFAAAAAALGGSALAELEAFAAINDFGGIASRADRAFDAAPAFAAALREAADSYDEERIVTLLGRLRDALGAA